jgi:tRNA/tmRNA/rRNA uracil-C5-methylase (TrmA/RlmC/RlmD family)
VDAELELTVTGIAAGGDAIGRDGDGRVVFVEGALPGERVRALVTSAKKDFAKAVLVEVVGSPSPDRLAVGSHDDCGGCTWQHVSAEGQRRLKVDVVRDALRRIAHVEDVEPSVRVPAERPLRTTARLGIDAAGRAGHRRRGSHDVVVGEWPCPALHPLLAAMVTEGRYPPEAGEVLLRVSVATGEEVVVVAPGRRLQHAAGPALSEDVGGRRFRVSAASFFQPGPVAAGALVTAVDAAIGDGPVAHVIDAYAGVGLFASTIGAGRGARVTAVEQAPSAVDDARVNLGDLEGARVVEGEVGRWRLAPGDGAVDVVVADPARPGLGRPGVASVVAARAPRIVLVSCDPASMARDVALLRDAGYGLSSLEVVDAFPDTFHIEAVSRFDLS